MFIIPPRRVSTSCTICRNLSPPLTPGLIESVRFCLIKDVYNTAEQGCEHCQLIKKSFQAVEGSRAQQVLDESGKYSSTDFRITCAKTEQDEWKVKCILSSVDYRLTFEIFGVENEPNPRKLARSIELPTRQDSESSTKTVQTWIEECMTNHKQCGRGVPKPLPKRILDLSRDDSRVFLIESENSKDRYVCQSYCWGLSRTVVTTRDNLDVHKAGISISCLPLTFRDTIAFTKSLGIRYLWIDSLCIVQDSAVDWRMEAASMGSYYGNAYLTIAATMSTSADDGLFQEPFYVTLGTATQTWKVRAHRHLQFANSPLFTRGWIFQERLLSPRVVHFACSELVFECCETSTCECGQSMPDRNWQIKQEYLNGMRIKKFFESSTVPNTWHRMVEAYCRLSLTNPSDIMPALSGLAEQVRTRREGSVYLAGLWSDTIMDDLLWRVRLQDYRFMVRPWRAPTWSWASTHATAFYGNYAHLNVIFTKVVHVDCKSVPPSTTGEVVSGCLILEGPVLLGSVKGSGVLYEGREDRKIVSGGFVPDWIIQEEYVPVLILRIGQDTSGRGKEYLLVLAEVPSVGELETIGDGQVFERIGLHEFFPFNDRWNRMDWTKAETMSLRIV